MLLYGSETKETTETEYIHVQNFDNLKNRMTIHCIKIKKYLKNIQSNESQ